MNVIEAVAFFNAIHALVVHAPAGENLRAYANWMPQRFIEAANYTALAVAVKTEYDALVTAGKIEGTVIPTPKAYAGAEGMNVVWKPEQKGKAP